MHKYKHTDIHALVHTHTGTYTKTNKHTNTNRHTNTGYIFKNSSMHVLTNIKETRHRRIEPERQTETDRQKADQTDRQSNKQPTNKPTNQTDNRTNKQTKQAAEQTNKQTTPTILRCDPPGLEMAYRWHPLVLSRRWSLRSAFVFTRSSSHSKSESLNTWILLSRPGVGVGGRSFLGGC